MTLSNSTSTDLTTMKVSLNRAKFGIFFILQIPSFSCSLYLFSQYAIRQNLRRSIQNHVIIVLLCTSFVFVTIPISASEAFFFTSHVRPESDLFCAFWTWIHYSINISNLMLMAFACGERHWLVFRLNPLRNRRRRLLFHYIPIAACMIYPWLFYFVFIFLYPCQSTYDYTTLLCSVPCYYSSNVISNVDAYMNNWLPVIAIPVFSGALLLRFVLQKRQMHIEIFKWKRDRKLLIQLLSIIVLYVLMWAPVEVSTIYDIIFLKGLSSAFEVDYLYVLPYFIHLLYPFVVLFSNAELRWQRRAVRPQPENLELQRKKIDNIDAHVNGHAD